MARECGPSVNHFTRAFRKRFGKSPYRWVLGRRIDCAKAPLGSARVTALNLWRVAIGLGRQFMHPASPRETCYGNRKAICLHWQGLASEQGINRPGLSRSLSRNFLNQKVDPGPEKQDCMAIASRWMARSAMPIPVCLVA
jgi:hypothetical protein